MQIDTLQNSNWGREISVQKVQTLFLKGDALEGVDFHFGCRTCLGSAL